MIKSQMLYRLSYGLFFSMYQRDVGQNDYL